MQAGFVSLDGFEGITDLSELILELNLISQRTILWVFTICAIDIQHVCATYRTDVMRFVHFLIACLLSNSGSIGSLLF